MKDRPPNIHRDQLPPCSLSASCLRLVDELDENAISRGEGIGTLREEKVEPLVARLRLHIPTCLTCRAALAQARRMRAQQRSALRELLDEGEESVPSMATSIMHAVNREPLKERGGLAGTHRQEQMVPVSIKAWKHPEQKVRPVNRLRAGVNAVLSLVAVAVIIIASFALFGHMRGQRSSTADLLTDPSPLLRPTEGWSSVAMTTIAQDKETINLLDPVSGKIAPLVTGPYTDQQRAGAAWQAISHDGQRLLFSSYDGVKTIYYLHVLSTREKEVLYTVSGKGGPTVWSTDDRYVFISTAQGVARVDLPGKQTRLLLSSLHSPDLRFYYGGYLYYVESQDGVWGTLKRADVEHGLIQTVTSECPRARNFWLSPGGLHIYYDCQSQAGLFAVKSDGSEVSLVRETAWPLIGYAADGSLLTLRVANSKYQVIKQGIEEGQDQILLDNLAPQGGVVLADHVQVAPYGHALVADVVVADGYHEIWYGDLTTGKKQRILRTKLDAKAQLSLHGWTRIQVFSAAPTPTPAQNLDDWGNVLIAGMDTATNSMHLHNYDVYSGKDTLLIAAGKLPVGTQVGGISPDGKRLLYWTQDKGETTYWTFSATGQSKRFHTLSSHVARNALWLSDSRSVLVAQATTVSKIDVETAKGESILPSLKSAGIRFYRYPYLYFVGAEDLNAEALYRINVVDGTVQQVTERAPGATFWLSPIGYTIYYVNKGAQGHYDLYAVDGDLTQQRRLRQDVVPIGYAEDNALVVMRSIKGIFQVVKLGRAPEQDQVLLNNVAPGAIALCDQKPAPQVIPICDSSIALAPLSRNLVIEAMYADGTHKIWHLEMKTGKARQVPGMEKLTDVRLVGWDLLG
jgi:hypothetical protein